MTDRKISQKLGEGGGIKYITKCQWAHVNSHKVAVAQWVHVLQHVTFIKHSILQTQLAEKAAVVIISNGQIIPIKQVEYKWNKTKWFIHFVFRYEWQVAWGTDLVSQ